MGHLVNPTGFRMGVVRNWSLGSFWYDTTAVGYVFSLMKDLRLLSFLARYFSRSPKFRYRGLAFSHLLFLNCFPISFVVVYVYSSDLFRFSRKLGNFLRLISSFFF